MYRIVVVVALTGTIGCHHQAATSLHLGGGCHTDPLVGPVGHVELVLAATRDTMLTDPLGQLVSVARWSSDSLPKEWRPAPPLEFRFTATRPWKNSDGFMSVVDTSGFVRGDSETVRFTVAGPEGFYELSIRVFAAQGLDTVLPIRRGFTDTARIFVQAGGLTVCA